MSAVVRGGLMSLAMAAVAGCAKPIPADVDALVTLGPELGALTQTGVAVWCEVEWLDARGKIALQVREIGGDEVSEADSPATVLGGTSGAGQRQQLRFDLGGLRAGTRYAYQLQGAMAESVRTSVGGSFHTLRPVEQPQLVTVAFGSCADEGTGTGALWGQLAQLHPDAVVLLGDTPYIDSVDPAQQEKRHREFHLTPSMQAVLRDVPLYSVWDDHDFGLNDTNGLLVGRDVARACFTRFRANPAFGDGAGGVYTSFRDGPVEVFLLDTRWFSATETGPEGQPTLLGATQWAWLERALSASTAPFKVIASSMVFNSSVRPLKADYWGHYPTEYQRLMELLGRLKAEGVILVSGDVHNTRIVHHHVAGAVGYDLVELVTSPMHDRVHNAALFSNSSDVEITIGQPHSMLLLTADNTVQPAKLTAKFVDKSGAVFLEREYRADDLRGP